MCQSCRKEVTPGRYPTEKQWVERVSTYIGKDAFEKRVVCMHSLNEKGQLRREHYARFYKHLATLWIRMKETGTNNCIHLIWQQKKNGKWVFTYQEEGKVIEPTDLWDFTPWSEDCTVKKAAMKGAIEQHKLAVLRKIDPSFKTDMSSDEMAEFAQRFERWSAIVDPLFVERAEQAEKKKVRGKKRKTLCDTLSSEAGENAPLN